jgi:hypothetical protein
MKPAKRNRDTELILALAMGATIASAARQARVTERTVYRRLEDAAFRQKVIEMRHDMVQRSSGMMCASSVEACKTLLGLLGSANPATVRLGAARAILEIGIRIREEVDLVERVVELERRMAKPRLHIVEA